MHDDALADRRRRPCVVEDEIVIERTELSAEDRPGHFRQRVLQGQQRQSRRAQHARLVVGGQRRRMNAAVALEEFAFPVHESPPLTYRRCDRRALPRRAVGRGERGIPMCAGCHGAAARRFLAKVAPEFGRLLTCLALRDDAVIDTGWHCCGLGAIICYRKLYTTSGQSYHWICTPRLPIDREIQRQRRTGYQTWSGQCWLKTRRHTADAPTHRF